MDSNAWFIGIDTGSGGQMDLSDKSFPAGGSDIDEVIIGDWFHLERMDDDEYMLIVGGVHYVVEKHVGGARIVNPEG